MALVATILAVKLLFRHFLLSNARYDGLMLFLFGLLLLLIQISHRIIGQHRSFAISFLCDVLI